MNIREMSDEEIGRHFPVSGWRTKCGLRTWLIKKERVHEWAVLGTDVRNYEAYGAIHGTVYACVRCGTDKFSREGK